MLAASIRETGFEHVKSVRRMDLMMAMRIASVKICFMGSRLIKVACRGVAFGPLHVF